MQLHRRSSILPVVAILALCASRSSASTPAFTDIDYPGAVWTYATSVNNAGDVVGQYLDAGGARHAFLLHAGTFSTIDCPSPYTAQSFAGGINNLGAVAGFCAAPGGVNGVYGTTRAFVLSGGTLTLLPDAGSYGGASTFANGINDSGVVVGWYADTCLCTAHGFIWNGGYATIDVPGFNVTNAFGINNHGDIVGIVQPGAWGGGGDRGFVLRAGTYALIDYPGAIATDTLGINDAGVIAGYYYPSSNSPYHAFVFDGTTFSSVDHPDAQGTAAQGINASGQTAGAFIDLSGGLHGYVTSAPTPAYSAAIQPPIKADGSSTFNASRGVVPVKFILSLEGAPTCQLPPATISLVRTTGGTPQPVNEADYLMPADNGSSFRVDTTGCQYVYNVGTKALGTGAFEVRIVVGGNAVGSGAFALK